MGRQLEIVCTLVLDFNDQILISPSVPELTKYLFSTIYEYSDKGSIDKCEIGFLCPSNFSNSLKSLKSSTEI